MRLKLFDAFVILVLRFAPGVANHDGRADGTGRDVFCYDDADRCTDCNLNGSATCELHKLQRYFLYDGPIMWPKIILPKLMFAFILAELGPYQGG